MGIIIDTDVFIDAEKGRFPPDWTSCATRYGETFISAITVSELLVGVYRADSRERRAKRAAFIESLLAAVVVLDFTTEIARLHAQLLADLLARGERIGAHDLIIAATALRYGYPVLTSNVREFKRVAGLEVLRFDIQGESL
ncbi:MAG: type II toxin-antitoxin system VapC family toxin [Truepera sp.]|nr:type II toxin-antitoxin system VapC family toxin [Truepera sp.]